MGQDHRTLVLERFGISAAHITDCALGYGDFKEMSVSDRVEVEKSLIAHIKRRSQFSIAICLSQEAFNKWLLDIRGAPSAYSLMLLLCVNKIAEHMKYKQYQGTAVSR